MLLLLAFRNLFRNWRRSLISGAAISIGLAVLLWSAIMMEAIVNTMLEDSVAAVAGDTVVQAPAWQEKRDPALVVTDSTRHVETLRAASPDALILRRALLPGLLTSPEGNAPVMVKGVEPGEAQVMSVDEQLVEGHWPEAQRDLMIGDALARSLDVGLGDKLVLRTQVGEREMDSVLFRVAGIYHSGNDNLDGFFALAALPSVQAMLPGEDPVHQIAAQLPPDTDGELFAADMASEFGDNQVLSWRGAMPVISAQLGMVSQIYGVMYAFMALIVGVAILNTSLMSIMERMREFGVLLSLGMRPRRLSALVVLEGFVLGAITTAVGLLLAIPLCWPLVTTGVDFGAMIAKGSVVPGAAIRSVFVGEANPELIALFAMGAVLTAVFATLWPAWKVTHIRPVDAMRHL